MESTLIYTVYEVLLGLYRVFSGSLCFLWLSFKRSRGSWFCFPVVPSFNEKCRPRCRSATFPTAWQVVSEWGVGLAGDLQSPVDRKTMQRPKKKKRRWPSPWRGPRPSRAPLRRQFKRPSHWLPTWENRSRQPQVKWLSRSLTVPSSHNSHQVLGFTDYF